MVYGIYHLLRNFVEFNVGSAKATVMTCCRRFFLSPLLFSSCLLLISLPTGLMPVQYILPLLRVVLSVQQRSSRCCFFPCNSSYLRVVWPVQQVFIPLQHAWCSSDNCSLSFPFRSSCITFFRTPVVCFASFSFFFSLFSFLFPLFSSFFPGLACFVVFSYPVRY